MLDGKYNSFGGNGKHLLDGRLFIDHLSKLKRDMVIRKFAKQARLGQKPDLL